MLQQYQNLRKVAPKMLAPTRNHAPNFSRADGA